MFVRRPHTGFISTRKKRGTLYSFNANSLLFDSSTDSCTVEQLGVFVLYFNPDLEPPLEKSSTVDSMIKVKMQFLSLPTHVGPGGGRKTGVKAI